MAVRIANFSQSNMNDKQFKLEYIKCPSCKNILDLSFVNKSCPNPLCGFSFEGLEDYLDKDDGWLHKALVKAYKGKNECEVKLLATAVRYNIANYLDHFVSCNWGSHYTTLFKDFIILYLDDLNALKLVLSSDTIKIGKGDAIASKNGYKMFWELYKWLMRVHSPQIRDFLRTEFPDYYKKYYKEQHEKIMRQKITAKNEDQARLI